MKKKKKEKWRELEREKARKKKGRREKWRQKDTEIQRLIINTNILNETKANKDTDRYKSRLRKTG